jgi:hypothetical protein
MQWLCATKYSEKLSKFKQTFKGWLPHQAVLSTFPFSIIINDQEVSERKSCRFSGMCITISQQSWKTEHWNEQDTYWTQTINISKTTSYFHCLPLASQYYIEIIKVEVQILGTQI